MNTRKCLGYLDVDERMILKCILQKRVKFIYRPTAFVWLRTRTSFVFLSALY